MKRFSRHIIVYSLLLLCPVLVQSQVLTRASVNRDRILIGEPIELTLDVRAPLGQSIEWFNLDSIPHFEYLNVSNADTTESIDGKKILQVLTITSFDSGRQVIPPLAIEINGKTYYTDTIGIEVAYMPFDPSQDYRDIKEIVEVAPPWWLKYIPWAVGLVTLVAIVLIVYLFTRKKKAVTIEQPVYSKLSPYEEALLALEELQKKGWMQNGEIKLFYSRLNDILRVFVLRKLNIATLEKTNEELIGQLKQLSIDRDSFARLAEALRMADFVKFARYQPDENDNRKNFTIIQSAITTLNNIT